MARLRSFTASRPSFLSGWVLADALYHIRCSYDPALGVYNDIKTAIVDPDDPASHCPVCPSVAERQLQDAPRRVGSGGIAWRGMVFHRHDFVKIKNNTKGEPCRLGQIKNIKMSKGRVTVRIAMLGRVAILSVLPSKREHDEVS